MSRRNAPARVARISLRIAAAILALSRFGHARAVAPDEMIPTGVAEATVDLNTAEGLGLVKGEWRYSDTRIVEADFRSPGPDLKPTGPPNRTYDYLPHAGATDFDDSSWEVLEPGTLSGRRSTGRLCFNWYRINVTIPERIGEFTADGSTVVFETVVDDYAEIWVDGALPRELGRPGGSLGDLVTGWNAVNRVVIGRDVRPGQRVQLAIFGMNGPISDSPANFIWVRSAKLRFYRPARAIVPHAVPIEVVKHDPSLGAIVPGDLKVEKLAEGFKFIEGPVWISEGLTGHLLFSGPNSNVIYRWAPPKELTVVRRETGYSGDDIDEYGQPGSNGLTLDRQGRLVLCEHGNHR
ncbi:MAG TPA: SMP-30/gluconolactonase/LRE family protein, partial [Candidatus Polarisedimenticolia bacterium]|nr:SMP-30/gluconolactonase/LRE family protein [Candidatus Polarisedimenticolia bacterium]